MTTGSWTPASQPTPITLELLHSALPFNDPDNFPESTPEPLLPLQPFARSDASQWHAVLEELSTDQLKQLCQFFTLAESRWSDWFGGDKNPVIWLCKELKKRGEFPDKPLTLWIKAHTENRFLPYGNPLG